MAFSLRSGAESILYESFENPTKSTGGQDPTGWPQQGGHPGYFQLQVENSTWSTPYGKQAVSTYSNGSATKSLGFIDTVSNGTGTYNATFNITSSASIGEYRAELWVKVFFFGSLQEEILVASVTGDTDGSKDMFFSDSVSWVLADNTYDGSELELRLRQDPNRSNWRHTPIWDNVNVEFVAENDSSGPELVEVTDNRGGGPVAPNSEIIYTLRFNEDVDETTVDILDFVNYEAAPVTIGAITEVGPGIFTVSCTPTGPGSLLFGVDDGFSSGTVNESDIADLEGNEIDVLDALALTDGTVITVEGSKPILLPLDIVDDQGGNPVKPGVPVTYTVTFSEDMNAATVQTTDFGNVGTSTVTIDSVTETGPTTGVFTVVVTPTTAGTLRLRVNDSAELEDTTTNLLDTTPAIEDDTIINVDNTAPTLVSTDILDDQGGGPVSPNTLIVFSAIFSEDMNPTSITAADFSNAGTAPVTIGQVSAASPDVISVEITPTAAGTVRLRVNQDAVLTDVAGNELNTTSAILDDTTITVENDDPYEAWSGGAGFSTDSNGDGMPNGLAWLLGSADVNSPAAGLGPTASESTGDLVLTFRCLKAVNRGGANLKVQVSIDIGITDAWANQEAEVPDVDSTVNGIEFDTTDDGDYVNVVATIPGGLRQRVVLPPGW